MATPWFKLGTCLVDSGQILLIDPCYVLQTEEENSRYKEVCATTAKRDLGGAVLGGVAVASGYGDGGYSVFVQYEDQRVARVMVEFTREDEEVW